ncbi:hypothetical protein IQ247_14330 [Plectonema cf. radiosum LEGE 06105]|uniref:Uncharacterized protein n=1 Tax=Plectonema cf. radiosum LEGE 06105 TaxID=945769 RepID=A0A8J7F2R1_9CYAN|nr:hypothetical protein [Plectonema radiosum]MBE9213827.1 hypothetical protein [Plectonema cf. radiosum LEGE 06105]
MYILYLDYLVAVKIRLKYVRLITYDMSLRAERSEAKQSQDFGIANASLAMTIVCPDMI